MGRASSRASTPTRSSGELGYDAEAIARLREDGVAWSAEVPPIEAMLPD